MFQQLKKMHVNYCGWGEDWELGLLVEGAMFLSIVSKQ